MRSLSIVFALVLSLNAISQKTIQKSPSEILQEMEALSNLGSVLYLAAHPDDENTRFISYCANELHMRTAYLSITRGDGGQNLIGKEIGPELGLIRTQELLAARRIDGGIQYFTPAKDFGYSKSPEETMAIWGEQEVLQDVVRVIRDFRPDVIVCRFPTDGGGGHGHHTASALLAEQAFSLAADGAYAPETLKGYEPWQAERIAVNTGRWWNDKISADDAGVVAVDVGSYVELLGTSCNELAAKSRSMHKSQGFGSTGVRGSQIEFFEHMKGSEADKDLFDGLKLDWSRVPAAFPIQEAIDGMIKDFNSMHPSASIPALIRLRKSVSAISDPHWKKIKGAEIDGLIIQCAGLFIEARSKDFYASPGDSLHVELELTCRGIEGMKLLSVRCDESMPLLIAAQDLTKNEAVILDIHSVLKKDIPYSTPYWLKEEGSLGRYASPDPALISRPEADPTLAFDLLIEIQGEQIPFRTFLVQKDNDPVKGETWRPFIIGPEATISFKDQNLFILSSDPVRSSVTLWAQKDIPASELSLISDTDWTIEPQVFQVEALKKGEKRSFDFLVNNSQEGKLKINAQINKGGSAERALQMNTIIYDHIPTQVILNQATLNVVKMEVKREGGRIGYIPGAGDVVAESLTSLGYQVDILDAKTINETDLSPYRAILSGIRLLNVDENVSSYFPKLLSYCKAGGNLIVQYNTRHEMKTEEFSPYPLKISRDRVTEEDAKVKFLAPEHPVMKSPNLIQERDFEGWVQERGLYFPEEWTKEFEPIFSWNDQGESAKEGALLIAPDGKGNYVYTGISFFRELPAGVPGAYRLLVNLIELPAHE